MEKATIKFDHVPASNGSSPQPPNGSPEPNDHEDNVTSNDDNLDMVGCKMPLCGCNPMTADQLLSLIQKSNDRWIEVGLSIITDRERLCLLDLLDMIAIDLSTRDDPYTLLPRVLALIANLSSSTIVSRNSMRRPTINTCDDDWDQSLKYFESNDVSKGVQLLINARKSDPLNATKRNSFKVSTSLDAVIQILVKQRIKQLLKFPKLPDPAQLDLQDDQWITATAPARVDLCGGWSDAPPMCHEVGGKVVNVAIKVNGQKPIGARVRKVKTGLVLIQELDIVTSKVTSELTLNEIQDVMTFDQLFNPVSIIKAALICTNIVCDSRTAPTLKEQLLDKIGSGIEIQTWTRLPPGSGLGTSSILASCIIAVLWRITSRTFTNTDLVHATLYLEQVITTGGGYQDQVAGIFGGVNLSSSRPHASELLVEVYPLKMSEKNVQELVSRILLIDTGLPRLAKNMLQGVIRNWYSKKKVVLDTFRSLLFTSDTCCSRLVAGDIDTVGKQVTSSWKQKKIIAPASETPEVDKFLDSARDLICGGSMAGSGGGGFVFVILKSLDVRESVIKIAGQTFQDFKVHEIDVDMDGIQIEILPSCVKIPKQTNHEIK